jgi:ribonuclease HI
MFSLLFDASSATSRKGNPRESGCGIVIYDENQNIILEKNKYLGYLNSCFDAECLGLLFGIEIAIYYNIKKLCIFGDCISIIEYMNNKNNHPYSKILEHVKNLTHFFNHVEFHHIPRKYNSHADNLSKNARKMILLT